MRVINSGRLFLTGLAMGIADLIPGVSGGTIAFISGIYERLLDAIRAFDAELLRLVLRGQMRPALGRIPWSFIVPLGLGIGGAIFSLAPTMRYLLENQAVYLFSFFFGLILASIVTVGLTVKWNATAAAATLIGVAVAYIVVGLVPLDISHEPWVLFLSGAVAIMAMILPGISGSFILLILGQYAYVLKAVSELDLLTILPVALGAALGLAGFARVLGWLLKHYHRVTVAALVGFMAGSLRRIWPWKEVVETAINRHGDLIPIREHNILPSLEAPELWPALSLGIAGFLLLNVIDHLQSGRNLVMLRLGLIRRPKASTEGCAE